MAVYLGDQLVSVVGGFDNSGGTSTAKLQSKTATPSESAQTIKPDSGYDGLSQVTVSGVSTTYVGSGVTKKAATTYTPGTSNQTIAASTYLSGDITIKGDSNLTAGNIKSGVSIFGVSGSYTGSTSSSPKLQTKTVTPSASTQTVKPDSGYDGLSQVTVNGNSNLVAGNIKSGVSIFGVTGTYTGSGSSTSGSNNVEAYLVTSTSPTVNFKTTSGTIKIWGYGTMSSSSGWGGSSTSLIAFDGDKYYKSVSFGSPTSTSLSLSVSSSGAISGLPSGLTALNAIITRGI
nr:MAG TPA: tail protein [Caudoviricetes sp.]